MQRRSQSHTQKILCIPIVRHDQPQMLIATLFCTISNWLMWTVGNGALQTSGKECLFYFRDRRNFITISMVRWIWLAQTYVYGAWHQVSFCEWTPLLQVQYRLISILFLAQFFRTSDNCHLLPIGCHIISSLCNWLESIQTFEICLGSWGNFFVEKFMRALALESASATVVEMVYNAQ